MFVLTFSLVKSLERLFRTSQRLQLETNEVYRWTLRGDVKLNYFFFQNLMRWWIIFIKHELQDSGSTGPFTCVAIIGPITLLKISLRPKCNHLPSLFEIIDVANLLFPEILLQVFLFASKHRFTQ